MLSKRTLLLGLLVVAAAIVFGAAKAALSGNQTPTPLNTEPALNAQEAIHARAVADGTEWRVRTYRNREGQLCLFQGAAGEGEGGTCLNTDTLFARAPVVLYYGSSQNPGNLTSWDRAWVWGIAADRVAKLDLGLTNCALVPLHADSDGIFQHAFPAAQLHSGVLPAKVIGRDRSGAVIFNEPVKLDPNVSTGSATNCG
jgi:hypothetical protein